MRAYFVCISLHAPSIGRRSDWQELSMLNFHNELIFAPRAKSSSVIGGEAISGYYCLPRESVSHSGEPRSFGARIATRFYIRETMFLLLSDSWKRIVRKRSCSLLMFSNTKLWVVKMSFKDCIIFLVDVTEDTVDVGFCIKTCRNCSQLLINRK